MKKPLGLIVGASMIVMAGVVLRQQISRPVSLQGDLSGGSSSPITITTYNIDCDTEQCVPVQGAGGMITDPNDCTRAFEIHKYCHPGEDFPASDGSCLPGPNGGERIACNGICCPEDTAMCDPNDGSCAPCFPSEVWCTAPEGGGVCCPRATTGCDWGTGQCVPTNSSSSVQFYQPNYDTCECEPVSAGHGGYTDPEICEQNILTQYCAGNSSESSTEPLPPPPPGQCRYNSDCDFDAGEICKDGTCGPCQEDADCPIGTNACRNGLCVNIEPPPPPPFPSSGWPSSGR